jgi:hypothetical protein
MTDEPVHPTTDWDLRAALHERVGQEPGEHIFMMVVVMDASRRGQAEGKPPWQDMPAANRADVRAELASILELPDDELREVARTAEEAIRQMAKGTIGQQQ